MPSDWLVIQLCRTLSSKGAWPLLRALEKAERGHLRYSELVPGILSKAQANKILGELQDCKLITKAVHGYRRGQYTAYELTEDGKKLLHFFTHKFQPHDYILDCGQPTEDDK